ncbi:hypothetical protein B7Y94_00745 [Candidatus Saccharibacteria bacterium 32-49-12]|nr:MAG: hypothetical protein B7Y94_00745 [Candidatus Saccharibacteria bacterium 32-49-12]
MANTNPISARIKSLQQVKTWQLVIVLLLVSFVAATFLRINNIGMIERRAAVIAADEAGDEEALVNRLYDLQRYVSRHMNTDLGRGVYLEASYNRALQQWQSQQYGDSNPNGNIYLKAQQVCAPQFSSYSSAYLQCTTAELAKYPAATEPTDGNDKPRQEAYIHSYVDPTWSPDFAGWSVLVAALVALLIVGRLISLAVLRLLLKRHYKQV